MAKKTRSGGTSILDKDLEKYNRVEEVSVRVARSLVAPGLALIFLVLATSFAALVTLDRPGAVFAISGAALAVYMAINIGANDVTNNVGAAVGSRAMSLGTALAIAAVFDTAGALIAGHSVIDTIATGIVDPERMPSDLAYAKVMIAALLSAALVVNIATWASAPVSTTHAIVGGVAGAGMVATGASALHWKSIGAVVVSWITSPLFGAFFAIGLLVFVQSAMLYREDKITAARRWVPVLLAVMVGTFTAYLMLVGAGQMLSITGFQALSIGLMIGAASYGALRPIIARAAEGLENRNQSLRKLFRLPLIFAAALMSFAHGANDVSNAVGPLSGIIHALGSGVFAKPLSTPFWVIVIGALGLSVGILLYGPRLIRVVGSEITKLNPIRAYCVVMATAITVTFASALGLPVSSTHIAVGAVFGVGLYREWSTTGSSQRRAFVTRNAGEPEDEGEDTAMNVNASETRRRYLVRRSHLMTILAAWVITVPASGTLSAGIYALLVSSTLR
ncbi:inorganic phosphate transporter [Rhizobium sp. SG2393]|uniref:inorganic phosphate transporter n=1 Tax=Rhizobium sp. SG2393 TaxID=3276279 RepID=UPI00366F72B0